MFKVSVPGNLVWFGEHAVLANKKAVGFAINKRMSLNLIPRQDPSIVFHSEMGTFKTTIYDSLENIKPWHFILAAIKVFQPKLPTGFELHISSEFSSTLGFGSSAALTVGVIALLHQWLNHNILDKSDLLIMSKGVIRSIQALGSGLDAASSIYGGVILYHQNQGVIQEKKLSQDFPGMTVVYSGYKKPTVEVVHLVKERFKDNQVLLELGYDFIDSIIDKMWDDIEQNNWDSIGKLMDLNQGLLNGLRVSNAHLEYLLEVLRAKPSIYGAKISGAGLGDCIIGLGTVNIVDLNKELEYFNTEVPNKAQIIPVNIDKQGIIYDPL
ncbi:MAG: mvk [Francisellaceae bacterium]|nr:mvk [Francisellaceae bacterium]